MTDKTDNVDFLKPLYAMTKTNVNDIANLMDRITCLEIILANLLVKKDFLTDQEILEVFKNHPNIDIEQLEKILKKYS